MRTMTWGLAALVVAFTMACEDRGRQGAADRIENAGLEASLIGENEVEVIHRFALGDNDDPAKLKLVYKTPAAIIELPVEFELKAIELP